MITAEEFDELLEEVIRRNIAVLFEKERKISQAERDKVLQKLGGVEVGYHVDKEMCCEYMEIEGCVLSPLEAEEILAQDFLISNVVFA